MPDVLDGYPRGIQEFGNGVNSSAEFMASQVEPAITGTTQAMTGSPALGGSQRLMNAVRQFAEVEKTFVSDAAKGGQVYRSVAMESSNDYEATTQESAADLQRRVEGLQESLEMSGRDVGDGSYQDAIGRTRDSHVSPLIRTPIR